MTFVTEVNTLNSDNSAALIYLPIVLWQLTFLLYLVKLEGTRPLDSSDYTESTDGSNLHVYSLLGGA